MTNEEQKFENDYQDRRLAAESDTVIAGDGNARWAVVSREGRFRWFRDISPAGEGAPAPVVLYSGLHSRAAAEFARQEAIGQLVDHGGPYGPSEVPVSYFNALGRVLGLLREEGVEHDNLEALACKIAEAATDSAVPRLDEIELPF